LKRVLFLAGKVSVIGSGDVFSNEDAQKLLDLGCAGAMVARGILRNPFLIHNLQQTEKDTLSSENGRQRFFTTLQEIAKTDEKLYSRAKFLEYAAMIWGTDSKQFSAIKLQQNRDILNFTV